MALSTSFGKLVATSNRFKALQQEHNDLLYSGSSVTIDNEDTLNVIETVQQKRKRLFNKETGSLQLDLSGTPFWIWDEDLHYSLRKLTNDHCCFIDIIGRPVNPKTGEEQPLFPYEFDVFRALFEPSFANQDNDRRRWKHVWIKKARGAGITELFIYIMLYLPLCFPRVFYDSQMAIVTGVRKQTAVRVMQRMKTKLYQKLRIHTDFNESVLDINGCIIEAYPIKNTDSYRGLHNLKCIILDEADSLHKSLIDDTLSAIEGFWAKNNPFTIINGTAKKPGGILQQIEEQPEETVNYKRLYILADKLIGHIYTQEDIDLASTSPYYRQEMWGEYQGQKGNMFPQEFLDYAAGLEDLLLIRDTMTGEIRRTIERPKNDLTIKDVLTDPRYCGISYETSVGTDPAFNSSMFASVAMKEIEGVIYALKEVEMHAPSHEEGFELQKHLIYQDFPSRHPKIYIDYAATSFIRGLKEDIHEWIDYERMTPENITSSIKNPFGMTVCPVAFNKYGDRMNYHFRRLMELGLFRMDKNITPNLWIALTSATFDELRNKFNKKDTQKNDVYDGARLAATNFTIGNLGVF